MTRPVTLFTGQWADLKLEEVAKLASEWGYDGLEIACSGEHLDVERAATDPAYVAERLAILERYNLKLFAISNHLTGQAVCDNPIDFRHQGILSSKIWGDGEAEGVRTRAAAEQASPEQIQQQIQQAVQDALTKAQVELKAREVAIKERKADAEIEKIVKEAVNTGITSTFAAMQAAEKIALNPAIAPVGDIVMQQAGWQPPNPGGQDPNIPAPAQALPVESPGGLPGDTTPTTPDVPTSADIGANEGIETLRTD